MQYNLEKCEVIHFGSKNKKADYYLNGCKLGEGSVQWDPCAPVAEGKHAGAAGGKEGKWYVGLHCERF